MLQDQNSKRKMDEGNSIENPIDLISNDDQNAGPINLPGCFMVKCIGPQGDQQSCILPKLSNGQGQLQGGQQQQAQLGQLALRRRMLRRLPGNWLRYFGTEFYTL